LGQQRGTRWRIFEGRELRIGCWGEVELALHGYSWACLAKEPR
jgi:hypothetical protein